MDVPFKGHRETEELVRGLLQLRPEDRLSLKACLQCSWLASAQPAKLQRVLSARPEMRVRLPRIPLDVEFLRNDLTEFSCQYRVAASLQILDVVVVFNQGNGDDFMLLVREELFRLLCKYLPDLEDPESGRGPVDDSTAAAR